MRTSRMTYTRKQVRLHGAKRIRQLSCYLVIKTRWNLPSLNLHIRVEDAYQVPVGLVLMDELLVQGSNLVSVVIGF